MSGYVLALQNEILKTLRSKLWILLGIGFSILPLVCALFMVIMKDPEAARDMGLISMKAQLLAGTADWPTMFGMLNMGISVAGLILFAIFTSWVFGQEFFNGTNKDLLAIPVKRTDIVFAKFTIVLIWAFLTTLYVFLLALLSAWPVGMPGWSLGLMWQSLLELLIASMLTTSLMSWVGFFACFGRGYLPPMGWAFFTLAMAQILAVLGWGEWVPWAVPALLTEMAGPRSEPLGFVSYFSVIVASVLGVLATLTWWLKADHSK
ncbi:MAG: ABC transporter permease [Candidatus Marinimicrobia bacterium]|nr:ABC transporter permease [Candidatus Neomarinimicrobiota bacterium]MCF7851117.1 ABC transporter permease [Candidatus Neomarinimicrobiota bacterium]MCF7904335.1 ABC transporter permease [Candidatus Neomarinimicrobiota bacterium]